MKKDVEYLASVTLPNGDFTVFKTKSIIKMRNKTRRVISSGGNVHTVHRILLTRRKNEHTRLCRNDPDNYYDGYHWDNGRFLGPNKVRVYR